MKKFIIICLLIFVFFILKNIMFYKIYSSKDDKKLAQIIENSIDLISKDVLNDYNSEFNFSDVDYICFPISIYSITAKEIVNGLSLKYKNATYLELKKQFSGGGDGSSLLMLISENHILPIFISAYFFDVNLSKDLKPVENVMACYIPKNKKVTINIKDLKEKVEMSDGIYEKALITIK